MKILKNLFKKNKPIKKIYWDELLETITNSLKNKEITYPVIHFNEIAWDFSVYSCSNDLISGSISGNWGFIQFKNNTNEIIIDSEGKVFTISHNQHCKNTKANFSYPEKIIGIEKNENLKDRICKAFESNTYPNFNGKKEEIINKLKELNSIKEIIIFVDKELIT